MAALNVNIGVLGHVDSGKTSLVRALSTRLSTASLDKDPQSQKRGITLDLGFSSFYLEPCEGPSLQVTLVDCPGHASLFRTILGGVAIIDMVLLVVDCRKGLQAQTIESLLLASLVAQKRVIVVLTKTDLLSSIDSEKSAVIAAVTSEIRAFLATHLYLNQDVSVSVVPVAVGNGKKAQGVFELLEVLRTNLKAPERDTSGAFCLAVDHCFAVSGSGTVLTGTVLSGALSTGDELEVLPIGIKAKVKMLQVFKQEVEKCAQGDRVGVLVNGLDPTLVERALAVSPPGSLAPVTQVVVPVTRVPFFRGAACKSGAKCHATVGLSTVIATATFFTRPGERRDGDGHAKEEFNPSALYEYLSDLDFKDTSSGSESKTGKATVFALLQFDRAVFCPPAALVVCSRLDLDAKRYPCRLAFYGVVQSVVGSNDEELKALSFVHRSVVGLADMQIGRVKRKDGFVDKVINSRNGNNENEREVIGRDMFTKDVKWSVYQNSVVLFEQTRALGTILGPFGKAGKFRIALLHNEASCSKQHVSPARGEKFVLRFLKLITLKPPKLKGKSTTQRTLTKSTWRSTAKTSAPSFIQEILLLYPEAFKGEQLTSFIEAVTPDLVSRTITDASTRQVDEGNRNTELSVVARSGRIERLKGETTAEGRNPFAIVSGLFSTEQEAKDAVGFRVRCIHGDQDNLSEGKIEKPFGKAGKVRVDFQECGGTKGQVGDAIELC
ncbi:hypothetical protein KXD40_008431 [Peronospora effusa]|uniref:Elongation factor Tu, chloroplastic n=1 Tax=Peronospora effusa TaxID=542832 RepID=A0A3M6VS45_9STRA|nr:hypothetical protein DD238_002411 [Peronospora effusa]UIZ24386.1 hypothetical protein KXD40_008431 [Peronospora effusa]